MVTEKAVKDSEKTRWWIQYFLLNGIWDSGIEEGLKFWLIVSRPKSKDFCWPPRYSKPEKSEGGRKSSKFWKAKKSKLEVVISGGYLLELQKTFRKSEISVDASNFSCDIEIWDLKFAKIGDKFIFDVKKFLIKFGN